MSYVSSNYKQSSSAPKERWVCAPTWRHEPYSTPPPLNVRNGPAYCGQCVSYVKAVCPLLPNKDRWKKGEAVKNNRDIGEGTVIATFDEDGNYLGHAAIYVSQSPQGITVWDQYIRTTPPKPIGPRVLRWHNASGSNNGNNYYVVEPRD
ncbi:BPSL0067 family protein [Caballeronia telluris]|uniref:CHAP domain protein n=1 Tax=Caballeronia telluris TaxID=326475 RepID=A0A158FVF3_9BURK|nr:BPSL0067 family protein [Caballeronia telluris]SAL23601.1 hypothetical protein AWB66_01266 [Caballeronia telluris]